MARRAGVKLMTSEAQAAEAAESNHETSPQAPPWTEATLADLDGLDFEAPIAQSRSADSQALSDLYRGAAGAERAAVPAVRIFSMLGAVTGMHFKLREPNEPFGPMFVFEGRRSAISDDFRGPPALDLLAVMTDRAQNHVLRARLADVAWLLDRRRGPLAATAIAAYVEVVEKADAARQSR
jgi:hypothetical protein